MEEGEFRAAMGGFATGVAVVCSRDADGAPVGVTVTSIASVSLDPPLMLFCLGRDAPVFPAFDRAESFTVSVLAADQKDVSASFARDGRDWFETGRWAAGASGAPLIGGRVAGLQCDIEFKEDGGDHVVFIGRVLAADRDESREPLLRFGGRYRRLAE